MNDSANIDPAALITEEYITTFRTFENDYYMQEIPEVTVTVDREKKQVPLHRHIMFIGITEQHLMEAMDYFENSIFQKFPWMSRFIRFSLLEVFLNIQSATLRKSAVLIQEGKKRVSSNCFTVKVEASDFFFHMDIIEHGEHFNYFEYDSRRTSLFSMFKEDASAIDILEGIADAKKAILLDKNGNLIQKQSHGFGMHFIESSSDGDHYITTMKFNRVDDFCKVIRFRVDRQ